MRFDRLGAFAFSPEDDTPAARMKEQISEETKQARLDTLMTLQQEISLERNKLRIGTMETVLIEEVMDDGTAVGRTSRGRRRHLPCQRCAGSAARHVYQRSHHGRGRL